MLEESKLQALDDGYYAVFDMTKLGDEAVGDLSGGQGPCFRNVMGSWYVLSTHIDVLHLFSPASSSHSSAAPE